MCVQRFMQPEQHILFVNNEGKYRRAHWESWLKKAESMSPTSWEHNMSKLILSNKITIKLITFPSSPPGNDSIYVSNKAHRSDFVRMKELESIGGIYLDTDAFALRSFETFRYFDFTLAFDNIVNADVTMPKRLNNGVLISAPNASFLKVWSKEYAQFNPNSFDYDSSVVPYRLATQHPDLVNIEMSRLSPISYSFQTSVLAEAITCGILTRTDSIGVGVINDSFITKSLLDSNDFNAIWHPRWNPKIKGHTFDGSRPNEFMYSQVMKKYVLHLTMSQVRGICMLRKNLNDPEDLKKMPSLLGRVFRLALWGRDDYPYTALAHGSHVQRCV